MIVTPRGLSRKQQTDKSWPMNEHDNEPGGLRAALRARSGVIIGAIGMIAWIALIWAMFGDVL